MRKPIPCTIIFNGPADGYIFAPIDCKSISSAMRLAEEWGFPFRLYDRNGKLLRRGWR